MSENTNVQETKKTEFDPKKALEEIRSGKLELMEPIEDGEYIYNELTYDFMAMKGLELARALDFGGEKNPGAMRTSDLTDVQALNLFAASAAKCQPTQGGLDATDIRERIGGLDAIAAINLAKIFFKLSSLVASSHISKT